MLDVFAMSGNVQVAMANTNSASKYHTPLLPVGNFSTRNIQFQSNNDEDEVNVSRKEPTPSTPLPPPLNFNKSLVKNELDYVSFEEKAKLKEEKRMRKALKKERRDQEFKEKIEQELMDKLAQERSQKKKGRGQGKKPRKCETKIET